MATMDYPTRHVSIRGLGIVALVSLAAPLLWAGETLESKPGANVRPAPVNPLLSDQLYDASANATLATCKLDAVGELDLLLFNMMTEDMRPCAWAELRNESDALAKIELHERLQAQISDYCYRLSIAGDAAARGGLSPFERLLVRALEYPVWEFVWLDRALRPSLKIGVGDERLYYHDHPKEFASPRRAQVRHIFRRLDKADSEETVRGEETLMLELRRFLKENPEEFASAARQYSHAPSFADGGLIAPFEEGDFFPDFEKAAFDLLAAGQISDVIRGPKGLFLIQMVDLDLPTPTPLEEVRPQIRKALAIKQLRALFRLELNRLRIEGKYDRHRFNYWDKLLDSSVVFSMGDFELTKGDFWRIYPGIVGPSGKRNPDEFIYRVFRLLEFELIREDVIRRGLDSDLRLARAREIAEMIVRSRRVERVRLEESLRISQEEKDAFNDANLAAEGLPAAKRIFRVWAEVADPRRHDAATLAALRESLPRVLQDYIDQAAREPRDGSAAADDSDVPEPVRGIARHAVADCRFAWSDVGYVPVETLALMKSALAGLETGEFSLVERMGDAALAYYAASKKTLDPMKRANLESQFHWSLCASRRDELTGIARSALARELNIAFCF